MIRPNTRLFFVFNTFFLILTLIGRIDAQVIQTEFGKNRVQYHDDFDEWLMYESPNFITYWYGKGRNIGQTAVQMAEMDFSKIQDLLEHRINDKIELLVYTDLTDLKQSNIGLEESFINQEGQTKIAGNKVFIYFNGDHTHLRRQIREGVANVFINSMLFGSNIQEIVQNAVLLNLPDWFKDGLGSYVSDPWNTAMDNKLRDLILHKKDYDFKDLIQTQPELVGHSMWYFIDRNYGKSTISNLLYLTRINRSIESGFLYVLGASFGQTTESWKSFYKKRYRAEVKEMDRFSVSRAVDVKNKRKIPFTRAKISPDGSKLAYVMNEIGKYRIVVRDLKSEKEQLIVKDGFRNPLQQTDYNYPIISWSPSGTELAVVHEHKDVIKLTLHDLITGDAFSEDLAPQYVRIFNVDYMGSARLLLTAVFNGFSDLFIYYPATRQSTRITNDFYDDLDAVYGRLDGKEGVLFASNRPDSILIDQKLDTILPLANFDLFFYALEENERKDLVRISNTPHANERHPVLLDTTYFSYLGDHSGIVNRYNGYLKTVFSYYEKVVVFKDGSEEIIAIDSLLEKIDTTSIDSVFQRPVYKQVAITHPSTNYKRSIINHHAGNRTDKIVETIELDGIPRMYVRKIDPAAESDIGFTAFRKKQLKSIVVDSIQVTIPTESPPQVKKKEDDEYLFQSEFGDPISEVEEIVPENNNEPLSYKKPLYRANESTYTQKVTKFRPARITPYQLKFRTDYFTVKLDNELLFGGLNTYAGVQQEFNSPPPGILFKFNFKDLFEDYEFEGGIRLPTTFNGAEYFLLFNDKKKLLDKQYALYRSSFRDAITESGVVTSRNRAISVIALSQVRYPLDIFRSIRATGTLRFDKVVQLATDDIALRIPTANEQRIGVKLEYVYDNTLDISPNIKNGTRYKGYVELVKKMEIDVFDDFKFSFADGFMTIVGFDARHYQRLAKWSVLAGRVTAATSFGSEKILYFIGGTENWLFPKFDDNVPIPGSEEFAYQTLAANMRGYKQNIRNGNSVVLINTELRIPFMCYMFPTSRSNFIRNFQVIGFFDAGVAWEGKDPFSRDNPLNAVTVSNPTVDVRVNYFRDPVVAGYGVGLRTTLFGYFLRADYGWGIETREIRKPRLHISLGYDF